MSKFTISSLYISKINFLNTIFTAIKLKLKIDKLKLEKKSMKF